MKFTKVLLAACAAVMVSTCAFADDDTLSKLADELTSLSEARKILSVRTAEIQKLEERLGVLQGNENAAKLRKRIKKLESRIAALNKKSESLTSQIESRNQDAESLRSQLGDNESVNAWHKKASAQITAWDLKETQRTLTLTILDRKSRKTSAISAKFRVKDSGKFYVADKLPTGLQVIIPEGWTVNADERAGYVSKIDDVENIAGSNLSAGSSRSFTSGEGFIVLKQSAISIMPPEQSEQPELESDSESESSAPMFTMPSSTPTMPEFTF